MIPEFILVTQAAGDKQFPTCLPINRIISITDEGDYRIILLDHHTADEILSVKVVTTLSDMSKQIGEARDARSKS